MPALSGLPVPTFALLLVLGFAGSQGSDGTPASDAPPTQEPPLRARVTVDGEAIDVTLGRGTQTADGRSLHVELLPTRVFRVPGALSFHYPRDWRFSGSRGADGVGAWWTLGGEGRSVYLRRHDQDARTILEEYVRNLSSGNGLTEPRSVTTRLGGRELEGWAVEIEVGSIGIGEARRWVQEVFAWTQEDGISWLVSLQRDLGPMRPRPGTPVDFTARILDDGTLEIVPVGDSTPPEAPAPWAEVLEEFRWE